MGKAGISSDLARLGSKTAVYGLGMILLRGLNFFLLPLYTRVLTTEDFGLIVICMTVHSLLAMLMPLGFDNGLLRYFFAAKSSTEQGEAVWTNWVSLLVGSGVLALALDCLGGRLFQHLLPGVPFHPLIRLAIWGAFFQTHIQFFYSLLRFREQAGWHVATTAFQAVTSAFLVIYLVAGRGLGAYGYLLGLTSTSGVCACIYVVCILRCSRFHFRRDWLRPIMAYGLPLMPHVLSGWVLELSDRAILKRYTPLHDVGVYGVGYQIATLLSIVAACANSAWVPFLFQRVEEKGDAAKPELARLATYHAMSMTWLALGFVLFALYSVKIFASDEFLPAATIVPWVVLGHLCAALYQVPGNLLFVRGRPWMISGATILAGLANVGLNLWLVPKFGILAAAWTTLASYALLLTLVWLGSLFCFPLPYEYRRYGAVFGVAGGVLLIQFLLPPMPTIWDIFVRAGLWLSFPLILAAGGFLHASEKAKLLAISRRALSAIEFRSLAWTKNR